MKTRIMISILASFTSLSIQAHEIQPYSMLEYLRTGSIKAEANRLLTEQGQEVQLELLSQNDDEYGWSTSYNKVIIDEVGLCDDATSANYVSIQKTDSMTIIQSFQERKNESGNAYIADCGELLYE